MQNKQQAIIILNFKRSREIKHNQTVNHDVTGSSPVGGAIKAVEFVSTAFFVCEFVNFLQ